MNAVEPDAHDVDTLETLLEPRGGVAVCTGAVLLDAMQAWDLTAHSCRASEEDGLEAEARYWTLHDGYSYYVYKDGGRRLDDGLRAAGLGFDPFGAGRADFVLGSLEEVEAA